MSPLHDFSILRRHCLAIMAVLCATLTIGCGSGQPYQYVPVSGKVTYEDGTLIPGNQVTLTFLPQSKPVDSRTYPRNGRTDVHVADGTFDAVTSYQQYDGILIGRHKVLVAAYDAQKRPISSVPPEYSDPKTTPLEVDATEAPFHFTVKKPVAR